MYHRHIVKHLLLYFFFFFFSRFFSFASPVFTVSCLFTWLVIGCIALGADKFVCVCFFSVFCFAYGHEVAYSISPMTFVPVVVTDL